MDNGAVTETRSRGRGTYRALRVGWLLAAVALLIPFTAGVRTLSARTAPAIEPAVAAVVQQPAAPLFVYGDTVRGGAGLTPDEAATQSCVQINRFPQGSQIVWRVRVVDPATGAYLDDTRVSRMTLTMPDGATQALRYGPHPRGRQDDYFWTAAFTLPADYPTGGFAYQIEAEDRDGRVGALTQFNVASSLLQVIPAGER